MKLKEVTTIYKIRRDDGQYLDTRSMMKWTQKCGQVYYCKGKALAVIRKKQLAAKVIPFVMTELPEVSNARL